MLAQGFLDLFFDAAPHLEYFFQFVELSTKAAFAKAAFDTLQKMAFLEAAFILQGCFLLSSQHCREIISNDPKGMGKVAWLESEAEHGGIPHG